MSDNFYLYFRDGWFKRGDVIQNSEEQKMKVIRTYKRTWWRKFIYYNLVVKIKMDTLVDSIIKVKIIK